MSNSAAVQWSAIAVETRGDVWREGSAERSVLALAEKGEGGCLAVGSVQALVATQPVANYG